MLCDFHTHTLHSDGVLLPIELLRRAAVRGYRAVALTDHVSSGNLVSVLEALLPDCQLAEDHWGIRALPGVELTHLPPEAIAEAAAAARAHGAQLILVHGETPVEPVPPGTNLAALRCPDVDILAHPGPLDLELAHLAARSHIFLELSARGGHCLANGAVASVARQAGALLLVNSDAHAPADLLTEDLARQVALGAALSEEEAQQVLASNPAALLKRLAGRRKGPSSTA